AVLFREGISFLWGIAKNYIMYWGLQVYISTALEMSQYQGFTNITNLHVRFCAKYTNLFSNPTQITLQTLPC
ncbi:MAG: hypothetical protein NC318_14425, partial [Blautia sp.]|nr:hypothetical protein [Blautia sp.]